MSFSRLTEPGCGCDGTPCLSCGAGDDGTVGGVLQTQLAHISEDGLHVEFRDQLLDMRTGQ